MSSKSAQAPKTYALLIGIDHYLPNLLPDGTYFLNLKGCVRDVNRVETYLLADMGLPPEQIIKLTATDNGGDAPAEVRDLWPTKRNIIAAFESLRGRCLPGDCVYIHYSGHGGRVRTPPKFQNLKGNDGFDEVLVPTDVSNSEDNYLRDIELAFLLHSLVEMGLQVTVVLDSCHSGSATRGGSPAGRDLASGAAARSIGIVNAILPPTSHSVASDEVLTEAWLSQTRGGARSLEDGSGWLQEPKGYVLLTACLASEVAWEYPFTDEGKSGALTYWQLDALRRLGFDASCKAIYDHILARVHSQFPDQTPQLQGERDRTLFGASAADSWDAAVVLKVREGGEEIVLNAGQAQGVSKGTRFSVCRNGGGKESRLALVEVFEPGATSSHARIVERVGSDMIEPGDQAFLSEVEGLQLRHTVRIGNRNASTPSTQADAMLTEIDRLLRHDGSLIQPASEEEPYAFALEVNSSDELLILDSSDHAIPNLRPVLLAADPDAPHRAVERLIHLTRYRKVLELLNWEARSPLAGKLSVEIVGRQSNYTPGEKPAPAPFDLRTGTPTLAVGECVFLRITNNHSQVLNVTALDLQPDWGIRQMYPSGAAAFEPLDPGQSVLLSLHADLPDGYTEGTDIIKVFATVGASNFRLLELAPLCAPPATGGAWRGTPSNPLEELLFAFMEQSPGLRHLAVAAAASNEWTVAHAEIKVRR